MTQPPGYDPLLGRVPQTADTNGNDEPEPTTEQIHTLHALGLRHVSAASFLYVTGASALGNTIPADAYRLYLDQLILDAGNPTDPIEVMMLEQLAMAHFAIGRLSMRACVAELVDQQVAYSTAATRLLAEFRRCTIALEDFRAKQLSRKQQAAHANGPKEIKPHSRNGKAKHTANGDGKPDAADRPSASNSSKNAGRTTRNGTRKKSPKKKAVTNRQGSNGDIPECIRQRMNRTPDALQPGGGTNGNAKG